MLIRTLTLVAGFASLASPSWGGTLDVPGTFPTIQSAIDAASFGDTICVAPGTYIESLVIDPTGAYGTPTPASLADDIHIVATGPGVTVTWPSAATRAGAFNPLITSSSGKQIDAILTLNGTSSSFLIDGITFDGNDDMNPGLSTSTNTTTGVYTRDANGTLNDVEIRNVQINATNGAQSGLALFVDATLGSATIDLIDANIHDNQKGFIVVTGSAVCNVTDSVLTGRGPTNSLAQNGIQFSAGGQGTVSNTVLDGFWWTGNLSAASGGILNFDCGPNVLIDGCTLIDCQVGVFDVGQTGAVTTVVQNTTFSQVSNPVNNSYPTLGVLVDDGGLGNNFSITGCTFSNLGDVGVGLFTEGGSVTGNTFNSNGALFSNINVQDEGDAGAAAGLGNSWSGNCYSDFVTNAGYPSSYTIFGVLGSSDASPNQNCPGFGPLTQVGVGTAPCDVVAKDFSGDGIADIATADSGSDSVTVLINDGLGSFPTSVTVALTSGDAPAAVAVGDLVAGDGCDLAVAAKGSDSVLVLSNSPVGTFTVTSSLSTLPATQPVSIAVGDFNGTAGSDLVVAMEGDTLVTGSGGIAVSFDGAPLVALIPPVSGFLRPQSVIACDLDNDGDDDVVATIAGSAFSPTVTDNILLYENIGGNAFAAPLTLSVEQNPRGLCCGDLDDDGNLDLAVTAESFPTILPGNIEIFLNSGLTAGAWTTLAFSSGGSFSSGTSPIDLACGDLTDDSIPGFCARLDIVSVNFGSQNLSRFNGYVPTSNAFTASQVSEAHLVPVAVAIADFNGDKTPDLVVANKASNDVSVLLDTTPAIAKKFGTGCPGTAGIPQIQAVGLPSFLNPSFAVRATQARPFAPTLLGLSLGQFTTDLGSGCNLYLLPPLVLIATVTNGAGEANVSLSIPGPFSGFAGCDAFFQYFVFDPNGSYTGQFAFSDGLRIKVGN